MGKIKMLLLTLTSTLLFLIATVSSAFACSAWYHQPETPKSLIK
ncbi:MAG: cyclic lactone autoinducer peptide [Bacillota bacterium]